MNAFYFLVGSLALLIALLFSGLIVLLWGVKHLITIGLQNDMIISFLEQISVNNWHAVPIQTGLEEDVGDAPLTPERGLRLHRRAEGAEPWIAKTEAMQR